MTDAATIQAPADAIPADLPAALRARLNGDLQGRPILAWSQFDLDDDNRFTDRYAVLTDESLHVFGDELHSLLPVADIQEVKTEEGLGVDRLNIVVGGKLALALRYSRRFRRDMTRLGRKLERRLPVRDISASPDWLEAVERETEKREHCTKCGELIPAYAEGVCPQCLAKRKILWRLLDIAGPYRWQMRWALVLTAVWSGLMAIGPVIQRYMIDRAIMPMMRDPITHEMVADPSISVSMKLQRLIFWAGALVIVILLSELCGGIRLRLLAMLGTQITFDLRHLVYSHLHQLSLRYFSKRRTGSLITRVTNDTDRLWDFIVFGSVDLVRDVAMIVLFASCMFWMNWRLTLIALIPLPPLAYLTYRRGMKMQRLFGRLWTYWSRLTAVVGDALPGVKVVKAFANEQKEITRFDNRSEEFRDKEREIHIVWTTLSPMVSGTMRFGGLMVWLVGGSIVIRNPRSDVTFGMLVAFGSFVWQFYQPIMELANSNRMVTRAATSAQRIFEVLDTPPEIYSRQGAIIPDRLQGSVEFRHVAFSYEGAQPALRDVSLAVAPGEMVGLCGPSGAGKSTFVNLICRFYDPTDGQILIDGRDLRDYDLRWLRRQVGIVLQEPYLFHGTIADNIRYGNDSASESEIIRAANAANVHDTIVSFPDGYDTMVGERGQSLSGGERQRISIARAILHNPRILILDEATSSVDSETEKQIQQALDRLVEGRTTFAIAHRLSTLTAADRLVVLDKGKIVEQGHHSDLLRKPDGVYAKLHQTQMELAALVA